MLKHWRQKSATGVRAVLRRLVFDRRGGLSWFVAAATVPMVAAVGLSVDAARGYLVRSRLSQALDAAALAGGRVALSPNRDGDITMYFNANFPPNYLGATVTGPTITVSGTTNDTIKVTATAQLGTTFVRVLGIDTMNVAAQTIVKRATQGMELVLVMDNTGSMAQNGKLTAMKNAATDLVNILYGTQTTVPNLWIGLVPFSQAINIGTTRAAWTSPNAFNWGPAPSAWGGCVDAREASSRDVTDDPPSVATFPQYFWPDDSNNDWITTTTSHGVTTTTYHSPLNTSIGPNKNCPKAVTPMTGDKTAILNGITAMQAVGNTHIDLGAAWGWRMLSPRWRGLWGGEMNTNHLPLDYNTPQMSKAVILLTDGDNTMDNSTRTAYWYLSNAKLGTTNGTQAVTQLNNRTQTVCNSLKANNVIVYTIALGGPGGPSAAAITLLQNCASKPEYFFNTPGPAQLSAVFQQIATQLSNLRIAQ